MSNCSSGTHNTEFAGGNAFIVKVSAIESLNAGETLLVG